MNKKRVRTITENNIKHDRHDKNPAVKYATYAYGFQGKTKYTHTSQIKKHTKENWKSENKAVTSLCGSSTPQAFWRKHKLENNVSIITNEVRVQYQAFWEKHKVQKMMTALKQMRFGFSCKHRDHKTKEWIEGTKIKVGQDKKNYPSIYAVPFLEDQILYGKVCRIYYVI